jgi:L-threonylcarbamoyladenylate synthase
MEEALSIIKSGNLVGLPTETVYGLAGDATNPESISKIYKLQGRPANNPLIIHVANLEAAKDIAEFDEKSLKLAKEFWPGPLSIVLKSKKTSPICKEALAGLGTIAVRIPSHEIALEFLKRAKTPIAAPSGSLYGCT